MALTHSWTFHKLKHIPAAHEGKAKTSSNLTPSAGMKDQTLRSLPNVKVNLKSTFGLPYEGCTPAFSKRSPLVPEPIRNFQFERTATACILAGLLYNKRVLLAGEHGSGKSAHIEQVCSKLNWPCIRLNMASCLTRLDLIGGVPPSTTEGAKPNKFKYGLLPWAIRRPLVLLLEGFDARRPEAKDVFNGLLKAGGELIAPEIGKPIRPNACFRLFATCNSTTGGSADASHLDGWQLALNMPRLAPSQERNLIYLPADRSVEGKIANVLKLLRTLKSKGKLATALTYRGLRSWCELCVILNNAREAFEYSHLDKCPASERPLARWCFEASFGGKV
ncbi:MAG: AAA family ATPase [Candidatus Hodgkinia cicadicola]